MKNMLRLMSALALTVGATPSVVACGNNGSNIPNNPQLNGKYAELLGWYSDENTSIIDEVINFDNLGTCIITADSTNLIKDNLFKEKLLVEGSAAGKWKAKDVNAATFLRELGFTSGNQDNDYSESDVDAITNLIVTIKTAAPGEISVADTTDFKVADGICQIDIMSSKTAAKLVKSYNINIKAANLNVSKVITSNIIKEPLTDLKLTADQGFKADQPTSGFKLEFTDELNKTKFESLLKVLNTSFTTHFFSSPTGTEEIKTFNDGEPTFLQLHFDSVILAQKMAVGTPGK
ncbi:hypothetical protein [Spiroplasma endosymbiont of Lasioglossum malachurum]|uniref:hypothetical protein n=1 Tax=Spiroplasma endosymbiont of Lasioglossum malachurum TaxID=3066319 RepID=UPI0030D05E80